MELLCESNSEIRQILGFTDADLEFVLLKPFLITATDEVIKLIGQPIYDSLVGIYHSGSASATDSEFLNRVQYPIYLDAYRFFTMENDLGHTPNGRVNRVEDNQKIAFEWQIERSNRSLERKYYKALDAMIYYMDSNVSGWKSTDAYKRTRELLLRTTTEFDVYFNIEGSRLLMLKLEPGIRKSEREDIFPRLGKARFDKLKSDLKNNLSVDESLLALIHEALVYKSLAWAIPRMSAQLFPEGLLQVADTSRLSTAARMAALNNEAAALSLSFKNDAAKAFIEIENYLAVPAPSNFDVPIYRPIFNPCDGFVDT